jgi:DNA-binding NarL/FixJ family response regulator
MTLQEGALVTPARETILVVDDEPEILEALARSVGGAYRVVQATSGKRAIEILESQAVDLLIADIDMPEMTGLELVAHVRRTRPNVLRFILTGVASLESAIVAINDGEVQRYLTKPWELDELRTAIRDALDRRRTTEMPPATPAVVRALEPPLSPRLRETLDCLLAGASAKDVARDLGVSVHTAREYVQSLYRRFDVTTQAELMAKLSGRRR